jgi:hypothetical protein
MKRHSPGRVFLLALMFVSALAAERSVIYLRRADSLTLDPLGLLLFNEAVPAPE